MLVKRVLASLTSDRKSLVGLCIPPIPSLSQLCPLPIYSIDTSIIHPSVTQGSV